MYLKFYNSSAAGRWLLFFALMVASLQGSIAQNVTFSETFVSGVTYCPGQPQYDNWNNMRNALDTVTKKFRKVTSKGTFNPTGITCTDPDITRKIAHALKTRTFFSTSCNGVPWIVSPPGNCVTGCASASVEIELVVNATGSCSCFGAPSQIYRCCIGNSNWGGINTTTCGAPTQTMELVFENPVGNNASAGGLSAPVTSCGSASDSLSMVVSNQGSNRIGNIPLKMVVTGTLGGSPFNNTYTGTLPDSLDPGVSKSFKFASINSSNGADLDITAYTLYPTDTFHIDDTIRVKYKNVGTPTGTPTANNVTRCGSGTMTLNASVPSGHTAYWYDRLNRLVGVGPTINSPIVKGGTSDSFFVAAAKTSAPVALSTGFGGTATTGFGFMSGNMFDMRVTKNITLDSLDVHLANSGTQKVVIYIKPGTYIGFQTNPGAWTRIGEFSVVAQGLGKPTRLRFLPMEIAAGNYAVYIYADNNLRWTSTVSAGKSDPEVVINPGITMRDTFANPQASIDLWNGTMHYRQACVSGTKVKVKAIANPLATGFDMAKGAPYKGRYDAGLLAQPDAVASPDTITYSISNPTNFPNSSYNSTWTIVSSTVSTLNGAALPTNTYKYSQPSGGNNASFMVFPSGTYTDSTIKATITLRNLNNGCDTVLERIIFVAPRPKPDFTFTTVCFNDVTEYTNKSTVSTGGMTYNWNLGDGTSTNITDPARTYKAGGNYTVTLVATTNWDIMDSITKTVVVKEIPKANFSFENACEGSQVKFADKSILPAGSPTYVWKFGEVGAPDGTGSSTAKMYSKPGIYFATLIVDVNGCQNSISKYVTQAPRAVPAFTASTLVCDNLNVSFTNNSTPPVFGTVGYEWNFGDSTRSTTTSPKHTFNQFKPFNVKLYSKTDLGCVDSIVKTVTLIQTPKTSFTYSGVNCTNQDITFTNNTVVPAGSTNTYFWDFGNGFTSTVATPVYQYNSPGTYTIELKAFSTNGCRDSIKTTTITIGEKPTADFIVNNVCQGKVTEFTNGSTIFNGTLTYDWDLGNSTSSTNVNPTVTYGTAQVYQVRLIATSTGGCKDTITKSTEVYPIPAININSTSNNTGDGRIRFSTNTTGVTYLWTFGDGGSSTDQNPVYKYGFAGTWPVRLVVVSPNGCINTATTSVLANPTSAAEFMASQGILVYPNPTAGKVIADFSQYTGSSIVNISVTDVLGRIVASNIVPANGKADISLDNQAAGIYNLNIETAEGLHTVKIMLSR